MTKEVVDSRDAEVLREAWEAIRYTLKKYDVKFSILFGDIQGVVESLTLTHNSEEQLGEIDLETGRVYL
jgi:hypothetical protein